jgi:RNA polymerase sigma-70 factor (ECF subfamily)
VAGDQASPVGGLVDHLFRHAAGEMVAALTRALGPRRLDLAEEVVQEALLRALQSWPYAGIPDNPRGWLFEAARNRAIDVLRRERALAERLEAAVFNLRAEALPEASTLAADDVLAMMFMCCHPDLGRPAQIALTLKTVGGFGVTEIAAACLAEPVTIAQRLVRAKRQIREEAIPLEIPSPAAMATRLASVLEILYLLFNEGYAAHEGDDLVRGELCGEAIRLARLLVASPQTDEPRVHALLALMLLQASRLPARLDGTGELLLLADQDRALWDRALIAEGMRHLERASAGSALTPYHVEAAFAAAHAAAPDAASTDWAHVLRLYEQLLALKPSPVVALNRAVALAMVEGPEAGIAALRPLAEEPALARYYLLPAARGALLLAAGKRGAAAAEYKAALALPCSSPERRFLAVQLARCTAAGEA